jgi:putative phosphoribosyl transferase
MNAGSLENVCTCKDCNHDYVSDCTVCTCCEQGSHSMVLDGIEGFAPKGKEESVSIPVGSVVLSGDLYRPAGNKQGMIVFAHGSGSSRHSPRNRYVAGMLENAGFGTLLFDLLTEDEESIDEQTAHLRFNIGLLADRLAGVTDWLLQTLQAGDSKKQYLIGYFGASTGAAAALVAAVMKQDVVKAIVSRGGRPDLAGDCLEYVKAPTLLIVGENDVEVIKLNAEARKRLKSLKDNEKSLVVVPGATHLFEEPGRLEEVAELALGWFKTYLDPERDKGGQKFDGTVTRVA